MCYLGRELNGNSTVGSSCSSACKSLVTLTSLSNIKNFIKYGGLKVSENDLLMLSPIPIYFPSFDGGDDSGSMYSHNVEHLNIKILERAMKPLKKQLK